MESEAIKAQIGGLVLEEDRVVHDAGYECFEVALLEDVDGVQVLHRHYPVWLVVGVLLGLACVGVGYVSYVSSVTDSPAIIWAPLVGGTLFLICLIGYFLSREAQVTVHAGNLGMRSAISFKELSAARKFALDVVSQKRLILKGKEPEPEQEGW
jgi:hypothetical protein